MKSEKAKVLIYESIENIKILDISHYGKWQLRFTMAHAVELAEQEAEERMQEKAAEAFCAANCPKGCSFGADGNIGCAAKARFIEKMSTMFAE